VILVTGAGGLVGGALMQKLRSEGRVVWGPPREGAGGLDLAKVSSSDFPSGITTAFLCAWQGGVAEAAQNPAQAHRINVDGNRHLIAKLRQEGTQMVFLSTSLVFSGADTGAHAPLSPCCLYGEDKAAVESFLDPARDAIVRITKVGETLLPRLKRWAEALRSGRQVAAAGHLRVAPVMLDEVVAGLACFAKDFRPGLYQMSAGRDHSYRDLAGMLAARVGGVVTDDPAAGAGLFDPFPVSGRLEIAAPDRCDAWPGDEDRAQRLVQSALS
jgi:nucleoside-diphosphate-sugar epimerase